MSHEVMFGLMMGALVFPLVVSFLDVVLDPTQEEGMVFTALLWTASVVGLGAINYTAHDTFDSWIIVYSILSVVSGASAAFMIFDHHYLKMWF